MLWSYFSSFLTIEIGTTDDYCYPTSLISRSFSFLLCLLWTYLHPVQSPLFFMWRSRVPSWPSFQMSCWFPCSPAIVWCFHFFTHYIPPSMLQHLPLDDPSCVYLNLPSVAKKCCPVQIQPRLLIRCHNKTYFLRFVSWRSTQPSIDDPVMFHTYIHQGLLDIAIPIHHLSVVKQFTIFS